MDLEKQIVLRVKRLIRVRNVRLRTTASSGRFMQQSQTSPRWRAIGWWESQGLGIEISRDVHILMGDTDNINAAVADDIKHEMRAL